MRVFPDHYHLRQGQLRSHSGWTAEEGEHGELSFVRPGEVAESEAEEVEGKRCQESRGGSLP